MSSELLALDHSGYTAEILKSAAQRVSAADLRMLQSAFGPTLMAAALPYAPAATLAAYNALPAQAPLPFSAYYYSLKGTVSPLTNSSSYLMDLIIEFYTQSADGISVSVHKAQMYSMVITGSGTLEIYVLPPTAVQSSAVTRVEVLPDGVPAPGPVAAWVGIIIAVVQFFDPDAGPQLVAAGNAVASAALDAVPTLWSVSPDGAIGGSYPSDGAYPPGFGAFDDGDFNDNSDCSSFSSCP
jgi:hypothetical protein